MMFCVIFSVNNLLNFSFLLGLSTVFVAVILYVIFLIDCFLKKQGLMFLSVFDKLSTLLDSC